MIDEASDLSRGSVADPVPRAERTGFWRSARAFELHTVLREVRSASHLVDVCLARLMRLMVSVSGYRRWGTRSFSDYVAGDLRQPSLRRFQYLVAIDRAICGDGGEPLVKLGEAWRRGDVCVSQARELIRVMTPADEQQWLDRAASMSVERLRRVVAGQVYRSIEKEDGAPASCPAAANPREARAAPCGDEEILWRRKVFAATRSVDDGWQVCLETSRRMAGYDQPVHDCVEDLLAEYASNCPVAAELPAAQMSPMTPITPMTSVPRATPERTTDSARGATDQGVTDQHDRAAWHRSVRSAQETQEEFGLLRRTAREIRLAVDPLAKVGEAAGREQLSQLDAADLHQRIRWLLRVEQNIAWHECRLLRQMADLGLHRYLGFESLRRYATETLGAGDRAIWGRIRLGRQLDRLPKVGEAFRRGWITALEATEICRVATGPTQDAWVNRARSATLRELREDVGFVLATDDVTGLPPQRLRPGDGSPCAPADATASWSVGAEPPRLQTCAHRTSEVVVMPLAHRVEGWYSAFGEDPSAVAASMLEDAGRKRPVVFFAPQATATWWDMTLAHCATSADSVDSASATAPVLSDSQCVAILLLGFLRQWAHPEVLKSSRAYRIFTRDGWRCQAPRCRSRARLHAHHIIYRSRNGPDAAWNLVTVCEDHHRMIHSRAIGVRGRSPTGLQWAMGINARGDVRERFRNGIRVACDPLWRAS